MPIYEYQCTSCHHHFDLMQKFSDDPVKQCPKCFENSVIKLISAAGFQLKGTGWYATDFKTNANAPVKETKNAATTTDTSKTADAAPAASTPSTTDTKKSTKGDNQ